ncbi:biotin--[acetyl-CoA-carboxylase] synthetase, partial [Vibrio cholerae]|nr:biotin--[acetyl-CoA-carboxylase] synthetase [Vibrio cholerae]
PWISLAEVTGQSRIDRNALAIYLIAALARTLRRSEISGMQSFVECWNRWVNFIGRPVKLLKGAAEVRGIERGISVHGGELLENVEGLYDFFGRVISLRKHAQSVI